MHADLARSSAASSTGTRRPTGARATPAAEDPGVQSRHEDLQLLQEARLQDRGHGRELPQHRRDHRARRLRPAHDRAEPARRAAERRRARSPRKLDPAKARDDGHRRRSHDGRGRRSARCTTPTRWRTRSSTRASQGFSKAIVALEKLLGERYRRSTTRRSAGEAARDFFKVFDLDGDGFITREEWGGAAAVFAALDTDGDGRITPEEMAAGLGGAFVAMSDSDDSIKKAGSFFSKLGSTVKSTAKHVTGVGRGDIKLELDVPKAPPGGTLRGRVRAPAGRADGCEAPDRLAARDAAAAPVRLDEPGLTSSCTSSITSSARAQRYEITSYPFELTVPGRRARAQAQRVASAARVVRRSRRPGRSSGRSSRVSRFRGARTSRRASTSPSLAEDSVSR